MAYSTINPDALRTDINPADRNNYAVQAGYTGWQDYSDQQNNPNAQGNQSALNGMSAFNGGGTNTLDLPSLYKSLMGGSGIANLQNDLTTKEQEYNKNMMIINDNPFLSEGSRIGRGGKLTQAWNDYQKPIQDRIAQQTADVNTQIGLATKQFDINNQQVQQAQQQFNSLLNAGALDNASPGDLARITAATGLPSSVIQSAIKTRQDAQKAAVDKANAPIPHVITSTDNNGNVTVNIIDERTGKLISTDSLGAISTTKKGTGGSGAIPDAKQFEADKKLAPNYVALDAKNGVVLKDILAHYSQYLTPQQIYTIYNQTSKYGPAKETTAQLKAMGIKK